MKKTDFLKIVNELTGLSDIDVLLVDKSKGTKYWQKEYKRIDEIAESSIYCFCWERCQEFEFTFAKMENILKVFFTKYVNWKKKREQKKAEILGIDVKTEEEIKAAILKRISNSERVEKMLFYTTLYGIGIFVLFGGDYVKESVKKMTAYLKEKQVVFENEYSEAHWVYRFVINKDIHFHNELLSNF